MNQKQSTSEIKNNSYKSLLTYSYSSKHQLHWARQGLESERDIQRDPGSVAGTLTEGIRYSVPKNGGIACEEQRKPRGGNLAWEAMNAPHA